MSTIKLIGSMALFVVVGAPLVWYLWQVLNDLLQGVVEPVPASSPTRCGFWPPSAWRSPSWAS